MDAKGQATEEAGAPERLCGECGAANRASAGLCHTCGHRLDPRDDSWPTPGPTDELDADEAWRDSGGLAFAPDAASSPRFQALESGAAGGARAPAYAKPSLKSTALAAPAKGKVMARVCAKCGAKDAGDARFCRTCGAPFSPSSGGRGAWLLLGGAAVAALAGWATVVAVGDRWRPGAEPSVSSQPASSSLASVAAAPPARGPTAASSSPAVAPPPEQPAAPRAKPAPGPAPLIGVGQRIRDPVWLQRPTPDELSLLYPAQAEQLAIQGEAAIECVVKSDGHLTACMVVGETPQKRGFGRAALKLAPFMRIGTLTQSGAPTAGRRLRVPVRWELAD